MRCYRMFFKTLLECLQRPKQAILEKGNLAITYNMQKVECFSCITMTLHMETTYIPLEQEEAICGKKGCIVFYNGTGCALCDVALEVLHEVLVQFNIQPEAVIHVDFESVDDNELEMLGHLALPIIRICNEIISGVPDLDVLRIAVMHALLRGCFSE